MGNEGTPDKEVAPKYNPDQSDVTFEYNPSKKKPEPSKRHFCTVKGCNKSFSRPSRLETHILSHTGQRPFVCERPDCDKSFTRAAHLKRHKIVNHSGASTPKQNLECSYGKCEATFSNKYTLEKHVKRFHETKQYNCDRCDKSFHKHHLLRNHQREHTGSKPLECPHCDKMFEWPFELKRHKRSHQNKVKICDICEGVFEKWSDLTLHKSFAHVRKQETPVNCDVCNKEFKLKCHLQQHRKIHAETREVFHCTVQHCPRFYYFLYNLEHHIRSYHNENKFPCNKCSKKLMSKQKLKEHIDKIHAMDYQKTNKQPTGVNRKPRKDKGAFKKPSVTSGHKPMVSVLTGIDLSTAARDVIIEDTEVPIKDPNKIALEMQEFVGVPFGCETSDSEPVVGCKRVRADINEFIDVDTTLMGVVKRIEQDKHFKKLQIDESEISSDTDFDNELKIGGDEDEKSSVKKCFDFSKYVKD